MVEVNVIMGAGTDLLVVDVVEVNVTMGAGMHSLVSCFAVNNSQICSCGSVYTDAVTLDAHATGIWCGQIGGGVGKSRVEGFWWRSISNNNDKT